MAEQPIDETETVALAMVQARWGNGCLVTADDRQKAREFIAAADALLKLRLAQQSGARALAVATHLGSAQGISHGISTWRRDAEGGLDRNEEGA